MKDITSHVFKSLRLITMQTDDTMNSFRIVQHYSGVPFESITRLKKNGVNSLHNPNANKKELWKAIERYDIVMVEDSQWLTDKVDWAEVLEGCRENETTLVIVNPEKDIPLAFDVGYLDVPREVVQSYLDQFIEADQMDEMMSACAGLSIRQVTDIGKIASSMYGEFTPFTAEQVRAKYFQSVQGLSRLNLHNEYYDPSPELTEWIDLNRGAFTPDTHKLLRPRGILADGTPGTGKTSGARHIARQFGIPCYLMRSEEIYNKYVGESGKALARVLAQAEAVAPCVFVMDEVEKLFSLGSDESHGTTNRLLAQLLWWLQEHDKMIITVMTTNNITKIPPELHRAGRLDCVMYFGAMHIFSKVEDFARAYLTHFEKITKICIDGYLLSTIIKDLGDYFDSSGPLAHSEVIQHVVNAIKKSMQ